MLTQDAIERARQADLLALAGVELRKVAGTSGGEYAGPCPMCGGRDRFRVQPNGADGPRWYCRQCGGGKWHDAIDLVQRLKHTDFADAVAMLTGSAPELASAPRPASAPAPMPDPTEAPGALWQERGQTFCQDCRQRLWSDAGRAALDALRARGLADDTIFGAGLGWNDHDRREDRAAWGLPEEKDDKGRPRRVWLPRGVVIPWLIAGDLWRVNIRRPASDLTRDLERGWKDPPKYMGPAGSSNALYNADALRAGFPGVLVEGEIDALTIAQHAGSLAAPVATGSTHGARRVRWLGRLALASSVLVCYDADEPGQAAAAYWLGALSNARRWRPYWADANAMAQDGADLRHWLAVGLGADKNEVKPCADSVQVKISSSTTKRPEPAGPSVQSAVNAGQNARPQTPQNGLGSNTSSAPASDQQASLFDASAPDLGLPLVARAGQDLAQDRATLEAELDGLLAKLGQAPGQGLEFSKPDHVAHAAWLRFCELDSQWARLPALPEVQP